MNKNVISKLLLLLSLILTIISTVLFFTQILPHKGVASAPTIIKVDTLDDYYDEDKVADVQFYKAAVVVHQKKDFAKAADLLKKQITSQPGHAQSHYLLARTYEDNILPGHQGKMLTDMKARYLEYLQLKPTGVRVKAVKIKLAKNYLRLGLNSNDSDSLEKSYNLLATLDANDSDVKMTLGAYYLAKNKNAEAIKEFQEALNVPPSDAKTKFNSMGLAYIKLGKFADASKSLEIAVSLDPANDYAYNNLGVAYLKSGRFVKAKDSFEKAVNINPANQKAVENLNWMASSKEIRGRIQAEIENSKRIEQLNKHN